jgi:hypothetical protein
MKETIVETNRFYFTKIDFNPKLFALNGMESCLFKIYLFGILKKKIQAYFQYFVHQCASCFSSIEFELD